MRKRLIHLLTIILLVSFRLSAGEPDFSKFFQDKDGCFILYDLKADKIVYHYNDARCALQVPPCSTFKPALAVMAFDQGVLKDENTTYKWDGVDRGNPVWNRDTSATDWIKNSVFWYSQRITPQLGTATIKDYLAKFNYGNRDISGGLTQFWLDSSLKISPDEELQFLIKLWRDKLPASSRAMELTKKIMYLETSPSGVILSGKTGSGAPKKNAFGWFVGHIQGKTGEYLFIVNYSENNPAKEKTYPGMIAKNILKKILGELKLY
jgi:beta-lactamase class D